MSKKILFLIMIFLSSLAFGDEYPQPTSDYKIKIEYIDYDGEYFRTEADEKLVISPSCLDADCKMDTENMIITAGDPYQVIVLGSYILQGADDHCDIFTNISYPTKYGCNFKFGRGGAVWNNEGDYACIYMPIDSTSDYIYGVLVDDYGYGIYSDPNSYKCDEEYFYSIL